MEYDKDTDTYTCHNGKNLQVSHVKKEKTRTGYEREVTVYTCQECSGCPHKKECIKGNHCKTPLEDRSKTLYVSKKFLKYREAFAQNINKLHHKIQGERTGTYLFPLKKSA